MGLVIFAYGAYGTLAQIALMRELAIVFSGYELFFGTALAAWLVSTGLGSFYARRLKADANTLFLFLTLSAVIFPAGMIAARLIKAHLSFGTMPGLFWTSVLPVIILSPPCFFFGACFPLAVRVLGEGVRSSFVTCYNKLWPPFSSCQQVTNEDLTPSPFSSCQQVTNEDLTPSPSPAKAYFLESLGGCAAGLLATFVLIGKAPLFTSVVFGGLLIAILWTISIKGAVRKISTWFAVAIFAVFAGFSNKIDKAARRLEWKSYQLLGQQETRYGHIALARLGSLNAFFQNGAIAARFPDHSFSEELIHWPLLAHPDPKNICLLGATSGLLLDEIFKHPVKSAIIIEPDRQAVDFLKAAMGSGLHPASQSFGDGAMTSGHGRLSFVSRDLRAAKGSLQQMTVQQAVPGRRPGANEDLTPWRVENQDPLKWLKTHPQTCDVIVHDVGQPANAASNRLFTKEFYLAAQKALKAGGILAFSIVGSENYMSPQTAYLDASVMKTVKSVFRSVEIVPGSRMVILAGHEPIALESNRLAQRYAKRKINNQVIVPSNFPFFLDNWRREVFLKRVGELSRVPENKDLFPVSYFYAWRMWLSQVVSPKELTGLVLICVVILAAGLKLKKSWTGVSKSPAAAYLGLLGFFAMTCEVVFLLGFQAMSGALFWQMGLLFAMFMAGLCLGSLMGGLIQATAGRAVLLAIFCALFAVAAGRLLPLLNAISAIALLAVFAGLLLICGAAVGLAFVFSVSLETDSSGQSIGLLYGADLWGSAAGAFVTSGLLIPILGMERTLLAAGFAAAAAGLWIAVKNDKFR